MAYEFWINTCRAFKATISNLVEIAVLGGILVWAVLMGRQLSTGFFESPSWQKVVLISMPIAAVVASFFAFWVFFGMVNPGETKTQTIHRALVTFFLVLLPLWIGCIWGIIRLNKTPYTNNPD